MSMLAIVYVHTQILVVTNSHLAGHIQTVLLQLLKFGTIGFFLISGFLLGEGLTRGHRSQYFLRRLQAVLLPWLFWGLIWFLVSLSAHMLRYTNATLGSSAFIVLQQYLHFVFFYSIYWFVPNFFVCLALVLTLYNRIPNRYLGSFFFVCSLLYGINVYPELVTARHTTALLGFVFYLWLGAFAYTHRERWLHRLYNCSWAKLATVTAAALLLSLIEYRVLARMHPLGDPNNTLRVSNQIFSVLATLMIVKSSLRLSPSFTNPRSDTFGIYLLHPILVDLLWIARAHAAPASIWRREVSGPVALASLAGIFLFVYLLSLLLAQQIGKVPGLRWSVGK